MKDIPDNAVLNLGNVYEVAEVWSNDSHLGAKISPQ